MSDDRAPDGDGPTAGRSCDARVAEVEDPVVRRDRVRDPVALPSTASQIPLTRFRLPARWSALS
jgi:hypothetical protein